MKLQLYSKQCLIVGGYHGERMKLDEEGELGENFNFCFLFSTSASYSRDIELYHKIKYIILNIPYSTIRRRVGNTVVGVTDPSIKLESASQQLENTLE